MITNEQEKFLIKHIDPRYFDVNKVVSYLRIHDIVGDEIFDLAQKADIKRNIRMVGNGYGFEPIEAERFIKRIPFYFYEPDYEKDQHGDLTSLFCSKYKSDKEMDKCAESLYLMLEKMFYEYGMSVQDIMSYPVKLTGTYGRYDIFEQWFNYLNLCDKLRIDNKYPKAFLYEYNRVLEMSGETEIIYEPGLVGFNEDFLRRDFEIIIGGEFPCDEENKPILKWTGIWIEKAAYIRAENGVTMTGTETLEKELHIGLTPETKIYMPNIYNSAKETRDIWYPIYFGPLVMEFDNSVLKYYRGKAKLTQQNVADAIDVQLRTYQKWENGDTTPDGYNLIRLMNYLNIESVQEFLENKPIIDNEFKLFRARKQYN